MKWRDGGGDSPTWGGLIEAMHYAEIGVQHIEAMKEELLQGKSISWSVKLHVTSIAIW